MSLGTPISPLLQPVDHPHHRRPRGDVLAQLRRRTGRWSGRMPASRRAVGQLPGHRRHHVLPVARPRTNSNRRPALEPVPSV